MLLAFKTDMIHGFSYHRDCMRIRMKGRVSLLDLATIQTPHTSKPVAWHLNSGGKMNSARSPPLTATSQFIQAGELSYFLNKTAS